MTDTLRFGLLGCGVIGPTHAEAIASLPDAQLVAVADLNAETAQRLAARYHARPYTDYREMLAREQLDVVTICTPSSLSERTKQGFRQMLGQLTCHPQHE